MKVLFISSNNVEIVSGGGSQCSNRNYLSLKEIVGPENIEVYQINARLNKSFSSVVSRIRNYSLGFNAGVSKRELKKIIDLANKADYVFLDSSENGVICYYLKKCKFEKQVITFFHNVEHTLYLQRVKNNPFIFWRSLIIHYNEKLALKYSNRIIVLTARDLGELKRVYPSLPIPKSYIIPISFRDKYNEEKASLEKIQSPLTCLFVGDDWFANLHGIQWFIDKVLDKVDIKLQIAGKASNALRVKVIHPKIEYFGFVPDLSQVINDADVILAPIFKGGGMKVKICEAIMFGKNILGTKEALNGYEVNLDKIGAVCNTEMEFVDAINNFSSNNVDKFNRYNRNCFLEKYSFQATYKKFIEVLSAENRTDQFFLEEDLHPQKK